MDLTSPRNADALTTLVEILGPLERHKHAIARVDAAVAAHPDFARFHEIRAAALADSGAPSAEIRAALDRALELDTNIATALTRLGRLDVAEGRIEAAVALFDRAAAADREDSTPEWAAIEVLKVSGKSSDIDARLEKLVGRRIEHADAVDLLARRLAERGKDPERAKRYSDLAARLNASKHGSPEQS